MTFLQEYSRHTGTSMSRKQSDPRTEERVSLGMLERLELLQLRLPVHVNSSTRIQY